MSDVIPPEIYEILKTVVKGDIENFKITIHGSNKKGDGYMGEVIYLTVEDTHSDQVYDLVIKQAFRDQRIRDAHPIRNAFVNEIYFYKQIWTLLNKFQETIPEKCQFLSLPKYFASVTDDYSEKLVLENLKVGNYEIHDKSVPLNKGHYELIMKEYGKFHAVSFAYKTLHPEDYHELAKGLQDLYSEFIGKETFGKAIMMSTELSIKSLQPGTDDVVINKYRPYLENYAKIFKESLSCNGKYSVITHGDCWSNNMMFRYDEDGKVSDVRFLDFQLAKEGSPCCDLSYCLYSGAPEEVLEDLDHYLKLYHNNLSDTLKAFGCDAEEVYPFSVLKEEWKQYCKLGLLMGLMIWKIKCTYENNFKDLRDSVKNKQGITSSYYSGYDKDKLNKISRNLVLHLYQNNFL